MSTEKPEMYVSTQAIDRALWILRETAESGSIGADVAALAAKELEAIRKAATALVEVPNDPAAPGAIERWREAVKLMSAIAKEAGNG